MRNRVLIELLLGLALLVAPAPAAAQASGGITGVDVNGFPTVTVGLSVPGSPHLSSADVVVTENGSVVSDVVVTPLAESSQRIDVVLAVDTSGSMQGAPLLSAVAAAKSFVRSVPASVRVGVLAFASKPVVLQPLTADRGAALAALGRLAAGGETALYDGVTAAARMFTSAGQHDIVLLSDGADTVSAGTLRSAIGAARSAGAAVYSVGLQTGATDVAALQSISRGSGGRYSPAQTANLSTIYLGLATQISDQYLVSYRSVAKPGSQLEIEVRAGGVTDSALVLAPKASPAPGGGRPSARPPEPTRPLLRGTWGLLVVLALCFLASFSVVIMLLGTASRRRRDREMAFRMTAAGRPLGGREPPPASSIAWLPGGLVKAGGKVAEATGFGGALDHRLEQAGLPIRAGEFVAGTVAAVMAGALLGLLLFQNALFVLAVALGAGLLPAGVMVLALRRRSDRLHTQLADVLQILASSLRAGHSFFQALDRVAKEIPEPAATEFSRVVAEIRLGRPVDEALDALADRVGSYDFKWATLAVNIQREVGGNLAEILDTVADTVRERDAIRREVDTLTIEGRLSMYILVGLPILIGLYMSIANREYISILFTTTAGVVMFGGAVALVVLGLFWMRRIVKIDV